MTHKVKRLDKTKASPYDLIIQVLKAERNDTGRRLIPRMSKGKLTIIPLKRNRDLMLLGPAMVDATVKKSLTEKFATVLTARKTLSGARNDDKGRRTKKKVRIKVESKNAIKRFGYVEDVVTDLPKSVDTPSELRRHLRRELRKRATPKQEITFTHAGVPTVRRWDAMRIFIPEAGVRQVVYVAGVSHRVTPGDYTMEVTCRFTDPFVDKKAAERLKKRCDAARKRGRKLPQGCGRRERSQPERNENRTGGVRAP